MKNEKTMKKQYRRTLKAAFILWMLGFSLLFAELPAKASEHISLQKSEQSVPAAKTADALIAVMESWAGYSEADGRYKIIIDIYNRHEPLARNYTVKYSDKWCDVFISAAAVETDMVDLIGTECSCEKHISIFRSLDIWNEDGSVIPQRGDIILYNWDDSTQPNDGKAEHIGVVTEVSDGTVTVIEGNHDGEVGYREIPVGWGYIRGYARPEYESAASVLQ